MNSPSSVLNPLRRVGVASWKGVGGVGLHGEGASCGGGFMGRVAAEGGFHEEEFHGEVVAGEGGFNGLNPICLHNLMVYRTRILCLVPWGCQRLGRS